MKPQFPLDAVEPDLRNVPELSLREDGQGNDDMEGSWAPTGNFVDESTAQTSIVVEFVSGIRGYCTAVAVDTAVQLLESLQPKVGVITCYHSWRLGTDTADRVLKIFWILSKSASWTSLQSLWPIHPRIQISWKSA